MSRFRHRSYSSSGEIARARAELTVASDRLDCGQNELQQMRKEILAILSRYLNLEDGLFEIRMDIVYEINRGVQDVKTIQIK